MIFHFYPSFFLKIPEPKATSSVLLGINTEIFRTLLAPAHYERGKNESGTYRKRGGCKRGI